MLIGVRGPLVRVLVRAISAEPGLRPVFISGMPGITVPATRKALQYRSQVDLVVLHSHREVREYRAVAAELSEDQNFGLATLPFLQTGRPRDAVLHPDGPIVFASQAKVHASLD